MVYVKDDSFGWVFHQSWAGRWWPINNCYYESIGYQYYENSTTTDLSDGSFKWEPGFSGMRCKFANIGLACLSGVKYPQCDDWFYGEINNYTPNGNYETLPLELKRVGFKLKYELSGVTDGEVNVKVYKEDSNSKIIRTFVNNTISTTTYVSNPFFYAFYDAYSAWQYADDYMEDFTLAVSWLRGIGITEDYGTKTIQLKRNCLNNIKINLGSNDQSAGMNLTVEAESTIGAESVTIPVE